MTWASYFAGEPPSTPGARALRCAPECWDIAHQNGLTAHGWMESAEQEIVLCACWLLDVLWLVLGGRAPLWGMGLLSWLKAALRGWRKMCGGHAAAGGNRALFAHFGPKMGKCQDFLPAVARTENRVVGLVHQKKSCGRIRKIKAVLNSNTVLQNQGRQNGPISAPRAFH